MIISLYPPFAFNQLGQRDNNEDSVSPAVGSAGPDCRVFIVCDGVGGGASGEVASRIVADGMATFFNALQGPSDETTVTAALRSVEQELDAYLQQSPDASGMATTLTLLHLHEKGATVAHVGDSRVYCCRDGRVAFQTDDHKLVNEWVKNGILTPEQAAEHPQQNVITRAVRGTAKPIQADVALLTGLRPNDYFFLCTDGVLENLTTEQLCSILATSDSDEAKQAAIRQCCDGKTRDNYSAYLVHIQDIDASDDEAEPVLATAAPAATIASAQPMKARPQASLATAVPAQPVRKPQTVTSVHPPAPHPSRPKPTSASLPLNKWIPYLLAGLVVLGLAAWFLVGHHPSSSIQSLPFYPNQSRPHAPTPHHPSVPLPTNPNQPSKF